MPRRHRHAGTSKQPGRHRLSRAVWIGLVAVALIALAALVLLPRQGPPLEVDVARAYQMYQEGAAFIDVRTQQEYDQQHIPMSILLPLDDLPDRLEEVPRDVDVVVVCRSGNRSREGTSILRSAGFARATCMRGGIQAWVAAGYPVVP